MSLINSESFITFNIPCDIPADVAMDCNIYSNCTFGDGNTFIRFEDADMKYHHLRKIEVLIRALCDKFPTNKFYNRLRADVCQMVHSHS